MKPDTLQDRVGYLFVIAIGVGAFVLSRGFSPESAMFPSIVSAAIVFFGAALLVSSFRQSIAADGAQASTGSIAPAEDTGLVDEAPHEPSGFFISPWRFAIIFALSVAYSIGVGTLGYYLATALLIPAASISLGLKNPRLILATTVAYVVAVYLLFAVLLRTPLTPELIFELFK
jgi:hypothetical protein